MKGKALTLRSKEALLATLTRTFSSVQLHSGYPDVRRAYDMPENSALLLKYRIFG